MRTALLIIGCAAIVGIPTFLILGICRKSKFFLKRSAMSAAVFLICCIFLPKDSNDVQKETTDAPTAVQETGAVEEPAVPQPQAARKLETEYVNADEDNSEASEAPGDAPLNTSNASVPGTNDELENQEHISTEPETQTTTSTFSENSGTEPAMVYVGSIDSDKYHRPKCRFAKKILPENEIWFSSAEDAKNRGYSACETCHPK